MFVAASALPSRMLIASVLLTCAVCPELAASQDAQGASAPPAAAAKEETFDILEFRVLGNTVLPAKDIERAVYPFMGPQKTLKDAQDARAALENAYHAAGYGTVFVDIPVQDVVDGVVRLRAAEGRIDRVRVTGTRYFSNRKILAEIPELDKGKVPQLPALQTALAAVNKETADRSITPVLSAGRTPGTVDIDLRVKDTLPLHGGVTLNDRYTTDTSRLRSTFDLSYGNLFQDFHSLSFEYQTAPQQFSDARVLALTYLAPLPGESNLLAVYGVDTNSNVAAVGTLNVLGKGRIFGARFIHTFSTGSLFHNINFGADFKDFSETINLEDSPADKTPIRYINWSLQYTLTDRAPHHQTTLNLGANFGISGLVNDLDQFRFKRFDARSNYFYARASAEHQRPLLWGTSLDLRVTSQFTDQPLISNEQLGIGGADTVRGYLESAALGDAGVVSSVELRSPPWRLWGTDGSNNLMVLAFYDAGMTYIFEPLPQQEHRIRLASAGVGMRFNAFHGLDAALDWAYPLDAEGRIERGDSRLHFQLRYGF